MTRHLVLILGDQLNFDNPALEGFDPKLDAIFMVEATDEATKVWSHKARIVLFLSAMRHFHKSLLCRYSSSLKIFYFKLGEHGYETLTAAWADQIAHLSPQKVIVCELGEYQLEQDLIALCKEMDTHLVIRDDTHFMCSRAEFKHWAADSKYGQRKELRMEFFYRKMRKKYQVLMQGNDPEGGTWNYDKENRKSFGSAYPQELPTAPELNIDELTQATIEDVLKNFPHHPGSLDYFIWPVTREQALKFLDEFITSKLDQFGKYQDAMWQAENSTQSPFLWHSLLSTSLNLKLLNPHEVVTAAENAYHQRQLSLSSTEGFIRQVLGWREFIRGVYWLDMPQMAEANHYMHTRALPSWYWTGETHMNCMRQTIDQTLRYGYAHHIQRLMVTGMFGLLAELNPTQVEAWYLAIYVDSLEWVELPNVAGMALYANGGRFTSKPYVASGAYINRMSNYCGHCKYKPELKTGEESCPITALYWNFLINHYDTLCSNPRTALMAKNVARFTEQEIFDVKKQSRYLLNNINSI